MDDVRKYIITYKVLQDHVRKTKTKPTHKWSSKGLAAYGATMSTKTYTYGRQLLAKS